MGKSTSKLVEVLAAAHQPKRYVVTNTEKIILVTHDLKFAEKIADSIKHLEDPEKYFLTI